tara:strand:- start:547 stop:1149 length:603 start_codon:yes stop_codon:yes gene_type:complete
VNKRWKNFIKEKKFADFSKGKGQWTDLSVSDLKDPENVDLTFELYDLIATAYANIGGHLNFKGPEDIPGKEDMWTAVDIDGDETPDALKFGKTKPHGNKTSGGGHDGTRPGKDAYKAKTAQLLHTSGHYAEMSKGIGHIMLTYYQVPAVEDEETVRKVLGKEIEWIGPHPEGKYPGINGWYVRTINNNKELKIMLGNPNA